MYFATSDIHHSLRLSQIQIHLTIQTALVRFDSSLRFPDIDPCTFCKNCFQLPEGSEDWREG